METEESNVTPTEATNVEPPKDTTTMEFEKQPTTPPADPIVETTPPPADPVVETTPTPVPYDHTAFMKEWELHSFTPGTSTRRVAVRDGEGGSTGLGSDVLEADSTEHLRKKMQAYKNFNFTPTRRNSLVVDAYKNKILALLETEPAIVIKGFTGCGKSTQVPQFILDDHRQKKLP